MKILRPALFSSLPMALCLIGCSPPAGPVTSSQLPSLTNAVQKVTSAPITRLLHLDAGLMAVTTAQTVAGQKGEFLARRTRWGWDVTPAITTP